MSDAAVSSTFQFELVSPEKILVSEQAKMVVVPGEDGDFGVLAHHAPILSSLRPGIVAVTGAAGETRKIFVAGGFADVNGNICSVLAEEAVAVSELGSRAALEEQLKNLEDDLGFAKEDPGKTAALKNQIGVVQAKIKAVG
jgi:F-type H+-transporting ATPase subunit epsilon